MIKSSFYIYIKYKILNTLCRYTQLNEPTVLFLTIQSSMSQLNNFKYCYVSLTIQLNISYLLTHSWMVKQFYFLEFNLAEVIC